MACIGLPIMMGMKLFGGIMAGKAQKKAGKLQRRHAHQQAAAIQSLGSRMIKTGVEHLIDMLKQEGSDIGTSKTLAGKGGVRVGTGSALDTEKKIARDWSRKRELYGRDLADQYAYLMDQASLARSRGDIAAKVGKTKAMSQYISSGAGFGADLYQSGYLDKLLG